MSEFVEIHWTCASLDEARRVCRHLVQHRWVACAQIVPWIESIYIWNNELETTQESKVVLKTRQALFGKIQEIIKANSSYQIPEITLIEIADLSDDYLKWIEESTVK
jgi:periplasmic divalent cation tolerance protein